MKLTEQEAVGIIADAVLRILGLSILTAEYVVDSRSPAWEHVEKQRAYLNALQDELDAAAAVDEVFGD